MIDLSNNNGHVDFKRLYQAGQRRVYLKCTEGRTWQDPTYHALKARATAAGFLVGAYHFARPHTNAPEAEARNFLAHVGVLSHVTGLRPCLDLEEGTPSFAVGRWAMTFCALIEKKIGKRPLFYSFPSYIDGLGLRSTPGPLWLASFGRNDGVEHPFKVSRPWREIAAHQFSSNARVSGASGRVDISHVFDYAALSLR